MEKMILHRLVFIILGLGWFIVGTGLTYFSFTQLNDKSIFFISIFIMMILGGILFISHFIKLIKSDIKKNKNGKLFL